jgi:hypothetical protein
MSLFPPSNPPLNLPSNPNPHASHFDHCTLLQNSLSTSELIYFLSRPVPAFIPTSKPVQYKINGDLLTQLHLCAYDFRYFNTNTKNKNQIPDVQAMLTALVDRSLFRRAGLMQIVESAQAVAPVFLQMQESIRKTDQELQHTQQIIAQQHKDMAALKKSLAQAEAALQSAHTPARPSPTSTCPPSVSSANISCQLSLIYTCTLFQGSEVSDKIMTTCHGLS